jgi:hypothetical protein
MGARGSIMFETWGSESLEEFMSAMMGNRQVPVPLDGACIKTSEEVRTMARTTPTPIHMCGNSTSGAPYTPYFVIGLPNHLSQ